MSAVAVDVKTLVIDGQEVSARAGQTILEVARETTSRFLRCAISMASAMWAHAGCAWWRSRATTSCSLPA